MSPEQALALRKPFPAESVGMLPKPVSKDAVRGNCPECGGYHGLPAVHLDYVGHAAVTDRLLTVDREWSWRPFTADEALALPPDLRNAGLWIHLTICGVTRIGVGDGKNAKECIGDAIRNAAMRFGVALDLWAKENLVEFRQASQAPPQTPAPPPQRPPVQPVGGGVTSEGEASEAPPLPGVDSPGSVPGVEPAGEEPRRSPPEPDERRGPRKATRATHRMIFAMLNKLGVDDDSQLRHDIASTIVGRPVGSFNDLFTADASKIIDALGSVQDKAGLAELLDGIEAAHRDGDAS